MAVKVHKRLVLKHYQRERKDIWRMIKPIPDIPAQISSVDITKSCKSMQETCCKV